MHCAPALSAAWNARGPSRIELGFAGCVSGIYTIALGGHNTCCNACIVALYCLGLRVTGLRAAHMAGGRYAASLVGVHVCATPCAAGVRLEPLVTTTRDMRVWLEIC